MVMILMEALRMLCFIISAVFNARIIILVSLCCQILYALPVPCKDKPLYQSAQLVHLIGR